ncbi:glycosyltransferase family 2 protein [Flavobacterium granuli]|uniref:Glycosyl transferase family 2 n=1 Tax=Flavobacterium granuli TaxID=280093 RepID=A0A1M5QKH9_9FLAO|nr:glycosyltransferase [Flavobacterium granuli]PRZ20085.1 glycosyl transferase family 2 [Flavobacterium granuli]SHH14361.1 Glycosyl transferase family 2 [Flavobacterium granuli]
MKKATTVSVCMITYGHENYIRKAIEGVLMQECDFEVELIIVNDCSPDKTDLVIRDILENHPRKKWIKYIRQENNLGMMPNFIFALGQCSGAYIALCEGDDYWIDPLKLQKQVDFLEENLEYVLCFHKVAILKTDGEIVDDFITVVPENYETIETLARLGNYIHTPSVVFRNIIKKFPFEFEFTPIGDFFLYMMLAEHGKLKYLEDKMGVYRHGVGVFSGGSRLKMTINSLKLFTYLLSYLKADEIKKIILNRQLLSISSLENMIANQYKGFFISNHIFFRSIKFINENYKQPSKIVKKIILKVLK